MIIHYKKKILDFVHAIKLTWCMKKVIYALALVHISWKSTCNERFYTDLSTEFYHAAAYTYLF